MNLKTWTDTLADLPPDATVAYDDGRYPDRLESWRGDYSHLTLAGGAAPRTVAELLADARLANGRTFEGYKGGDYTMDEHTPVWADEYGRCQCFGIASVELVGNVHVVVHTMDLSDYRW